MTRHRRVTLTPPGDFEEVCVEQSATRTLGVDASLPPGVRIRWFRSLLARAMVDGGRAGGRVPNGAIVWADAPEAFPEAAAATALPGAQDGPHALPEPVGRGEATPTIREAVSEALGALPEALRVDAAEEVEAALAAVGI